MNKIAIAAITTTVAAAAGYIALRQGLISLDGKLATYIPARVTKHFRDIHEARAAKTAAAETARTTAAAGEVKAEETDTTKPAADASSPVKAAVVGVMDVAATAMGGLAAAAAA